MNGFDVVIFNLGTDELDGITAFEVDILESTDAVLVVKASFKKPEPVSTVPQPAPSPTPPPEVEDPGPTEEQVDVFAEMPELPQLVPA